MSPSCPNQKIIKRAVSHGVQTYEGDPSLLDNLFAILSLRRTSQYKTQLKASVYSHGLEPPDALQLLWLLVHLFPDKAAELPRQGPAKPPPPPNAATCQHQGREMPASSLA